MSRCPRFLHILLLAAAPAAIGAPGGACADDLSDFLAVYHCPIVNVLTQVHETPYTSDDEDHYFVVSQPGTKQNNYVQCLFMEHNRRLLCEAASGYYDRLPGQKRRYLSPSARNAIGQSGFSIDDSQGNFQRMFDVSTAGVFDSAADAILTVLHNGYGMASTTPLQINAPFAGGKVHKEYCVPVS